MLKYFRRKGSSDAEQAEGAEQPSTSETPTEPAEDTSGKKSSFFSRFRLGGKDSTPSEPTLPSPEEDRKSAPETALHREPEPERQPTSPSEPQPLTQETTPDSHSFAAPTQVAPHTAAETTEPEPAPPVQEQEPAVEKGGFFARLKQTSFIPGMGQANKAPAEEGKKSLPETPPHQEPEPERQPTPPSEPQPTTQSVEPHHPQDTLATPAQAASHTAAETREPESTPPVQEQEPAVEKESFFARLKQTTIIPGMGQTSKTPAPAETMSEDGASEGAHAEMEGGGQEAEQPEKTSFFSRFRFGQKPKPKTEEQKQEEKQTFFDRLKEGLDRTRENLVESVERITHGKKQIDDDLLEELEDILLTSDLGVEATTAIIEDVTERVRRKDLTDPSALRAAVKQALLDILKPVEQPWEPSPEADTTQVIMVVGINGSGKTTTIGKLAARWHHEGYNVVMAAGDTFRAAAIEQLQEWGVRAEVPVIAQKSGSDSASVIYDALETSRAKGAHILLADTAGRLHTQLNLMEELKKVKRVMSKLDAQAPHETWLVLDAGIGQNAVQQAKQFHEAVTLTGICITKLDGTAKGGVIAGIAQKLNIPIRYIGVGEKPEDLRPFDAESFVDALFGHDDTRD